MKFKAKLADQLKDDLSTLEEIFDLIAGIRTDISSDLSDGEAIEEVREKLISITGCEKWENNSFNRVNSKKVKEPCQYCKNLDVDRDPGTNEVYPICEYGDPTT